MLHRECFETLMFWWNLVVFFTYICTAERIVSDHILDPVVQSIVSLTISLRHKFVKQISAKVTNTLLFFVEKM